MISLNDQILYTLTIQVNTREGALEIRKIFCRVCHSFLKRTMLLVIKHTDKNDKRVTIQVGVILAKKNTFPVIFSLFFSP